MTETHWLFPSSPPSGSCRVSATSSIMEIFIVSFQVYTNVAKCRATQKFAMFKVKTGYKIERVIHWQYLSQALLLP